MATISGDLKAKFTDDLGEPLVGGKVYTYHAGTSTPKDSYQDKEFAIVNTNPIILDDAGSCDLYLNGLYRLRVLDKDGVFVEERDYMTQGDSTGSSITDNANNITVLQSEVQAINERSVLKLDENNFVIGHGSANSATVHDPAFRADKLKLALQGQEDSARNIFKTYATDTTLNGNEIKAGTYLDPELQAVELGTAATRNVGAGGEQIPTNAQADNKYMAKGFYGIGTTEPNGVYNTLYHTTYLEVMEKVGHLRPVLLSNAGAWGYPSGINIRLGSNVTAGLFYSRLSTGNANSALRLVLKYDATTKTGFILTSGMNAFADNNGFWKTSSPVVRVYANEIDPNDDAEKQGVTFTRNGVGDYTLHNTLGLAQEGWQIELPQDNNRNPLVAIETEYTKDGDLNIRTYKRIFSMETFTFTCDYDNPLDIPEGRCVDVRLHEEREDADSQDS